MIQLLIKLSYQTAKRSPVTFFANILWIVLGAALGIVSSYTMKLWTNAVTDAQGTGVITWAIFLPTLIFFLTMTLTGNTQNFAEMLKSAYTYKTNLFYYKEFLKKSETINQDQYYDNAFYDNYEFVKNNIGRTTNLVAVVFNQLLSAVIDLVFTITAVAFFDFKIIAVLCLLSVALIFLNRYLVGCELKLNRDYIPDERRANYYYDLVKGRDSAKELRQNRSGEWFLAKWEQYFLKFKNARFRFEVKNQLLNSLVGALNSMIPFGVAIYLVILVYQSKIDTGNAIFLYSITSYINYSIQSVVRVFSRDLNSNYQYVKAYLDFISHEETKPEAAQTAKEQSGFQQLCLSDVTYRYPNSDHEAVSHVNLTIKKGEVVSILGYNGSGKTTLSKIICGLLENYTGKVSFNGEDIRGLRSEQYFQNYGVCFQEYTRYSLSVKENVGIGKLSAMDDPATLQTAYQAGNIDAFVDRLPQKYETLLGKEFSEEGTDLSGGQWQRVAIARAYMGAPDLIILDEPTASIDPMEEEKLLEHFRELICGRTAILISHRIGFARLADRIVIMEDGKVKEEGSHDELIGRKDGTYRQLFMAQKQTYESGVSANA